MRLMNKLLRKGRLKSFVVVYLDDIVIFSRTEREHREHVAAVLSILSQEGFKLQPNKCFFEKRGIDFCGFWVDELGIHTESSKVAAVEDWPTPTSPRQVREFSGLTGFYRKFILPYATIALPLYQQAQAV